MSNIYNIQQDLLAIFDAIEDNEGEITPELAEVLSIKQEEFKDKIKDYTSVIKMLESDVTSIKEERERLYELQKSKEKTIDRLKKIIIEAVDNFGNTTKTGGKFVDYGTGKVSVRNTQSVDVDASAVDRFVNRFITCFKWYSENNQLNTFLVNSDDILNWINTRSPIEESQDIEVDKFDIKDINRLSADIDLNVNLETLMSTNEGINLLDALLKYNVFNIRAKVDKTGIKNDAKGEEHFMPVYAKLNNNKSLTIK